MPFKDPEAKKAYMRRWYAEHAERVIAKVKARKWHAYGGTCHNCGGPTMGNSKGQAAEFCHKPECRREQWRQKNAQSS
jgi:hypothetical protein